MVMNIQYLLVILASVINCAYCDFDIDTTCGFHGLYFNKTNSCICEPNYSPPNCAWTGCVNGEHVTLEDMDACICVPPFIGTRCDTIDCGANGYFDPSTSTCKCDKGWGGDTCTSCINNDPESEIVNVCCPRYAVVPFTSTKQPNIKSYEWLLLTLVQSELRKYLSGIMTKPACILPGNNLTLRYDFDKTMTCYVDCSCNLYKLEEPGYFVNSEKRSITSETHSVVVKSVSDSKSIDDFYKVVNTHQKSRKITPVSFIATLSGPGYYFFVVVIVVITLVAVAIIILVVFGLLPELFHFSFEKIKIDPKDDYQPQFPPKEQEDEVESHQQLNVKGQQLQPAKINSQDTYHGNRSMSSIDTKIMKQLLSKE